MLDDHGARGKPDAGDIFLDCLVGCGLAGENEVPAAVEGGLADGLVREQIVAKIDRLEMGVLGAMRGQPAPSGSAFAILLLRAVLRDDEFRFQRHDLIMSRCDKARRQHGVVVLDLAVGP